jgi:putative ABC transport system permease protein
MLLFFYKLLRFSVPIGFSVSMPAITVTAILFCAVFAATLLMNLLHIRLSKPIELLKGGQAGEREPKTKALLAVLGVLALGGGYYIALTTKSPLTAIMLFFVAVILVIIGTYFLFTAGSIAALKILRSNKRFYYQTNHFTSVSGMIYRMKQNAVGLASICILSTMVLVMVSGTVSMNLGIEDVLDGMYPSDISLTVGSIQEGEVSEIRDAAEHAAADEGLTVSNVWNYMYLSFTATRTGITLRRRPAVVKAQATTPPGSAS